MNWAIDGSAGMHAYAVFAVYARRRILGRHNVSVERLCRVRVYTRLVINYSIFQFIRD